MQKRCRNLMKPSLRLDVSLRFSVDARASSSDQVTPWCGDCCCVCLVNKIRMSPLTGSVLFRFFVLFAVLLPPAPPLLLLPPPPPPPPPLLLLSPSPRRPLPVPPPSFLSLLSLVSLRFFLASDIPREFVPSSSTVDSLTSLMACSRKRWPLGHMFML